MNRNAVTGQIQDTLRNMHREVQDNGVTEIASDMWDHALRMYRKHKNMEDPNSDFAFDPSTPVFLRRQAD